LATCSSLQWPRGQRPRRHCGLCRAPADAAPHLLICSADNTNVKAQDLVIVAAWTFAKRSELLTFCVAMMAKCFSLQRLRGQRPRCHCGLCRAPAGTTPHLVACRADNTNVEVQDLFIFAAWTLAKAQKAFDILCCDLDILCRRSLPFVCMPESSVRHTSGAACTVRLWPRNHAIGLFATSIHFAHVAESCMGQTKERFLCDLSKTNATLISVCTGGCHGLQLTMNGANGRPWMPSSSSPMDANGCHPLHGPAAMHLQS